MQSAENVLKHRNDLDLGFAVGHMTWPSMPSHDPWVASGTRHGSLSSKLYISL